VLHTKKIAILSAFTALFAQATFADTTESFVVVAPQCLIKTITAPFKTLSVKQDYALIKLNTLGFNQLIAGKANQTTPCGGFVNVSDAFQAQLANEHNLSEFMSRYIPQSFTTTQSAHYGISHSKEVNQLLSTLNPDQMWKNLTKLTSFTDRYSKSDNGVKAALWIKSQVEAMAKENGRTDVTAYTVKTGTQYKQPSVVIKIGDSKEPAVVIGAHMDTLQAYFGNMPGADDDGTGTVTVLELARVLLSSNLHFKKPIYLIWYSAEEMGLVGSQYVVADFKKQKIAVEEVMHFDMTGYAAKNDPTMWLLSDNTNKELTTYLETLIKTYVKKPFKYTTCGYACSDHATWTSNGYKAACPFEAEFGKYNPYIHTSQDTMSVISLDHMTDFTKLAIAFTAELADPINA
jgi:leucyl aminopeptidase